LRSSDRSLSATLRIAVMRAGKQGDDGCFDLKRFGAPADACAQYQAERAASARGNDDEATACPASRSAVARRSAVAAPSVRRS